MEQFTRSRSHGRATQHNIHPTKITNGTDLTKLSNLKYSDKRKCKRNFGSKFHEDELESGGTNMNTFATYKAGPANGFSQTHSQANPQPSRKYSARITGRTRSSYHKDQQDGLSPDKNSRSFEPPRGNNSEFVGQWQRNGPEPFKPYTDYQPTACDRGNGYQNFNTHERSLPSSPVSSQDQATDNSDTNQFTSVQETDFPQPSCNEQIYDPQCINSYQINNWQSTSELAHLENNSQHAYNFPPYVHDSKQSHWHIPHYMENGLFMSPHFEHARMLKPLPIYTDLYYQLPEHLNAEWGMPYYTSGGLFVNPLATCGIQHVGGLMNVNP